MTAKNPQSGYTLIETLIYAAILASLSIFVANTIILAFASFNKARLDRRVVIDAETVLERIARESRTASSVDEAQSILGLNPSKLVLNSVVSPEDGTAITRQFFVSGGRLAFQEGSGEARFLTSPGSSVSSFVVSKSDTLRSQAVKVSLTLEAESGRNQTVRSFYVSAVLRGGY